MNVQPQVHQLVKRATRILVSLGVVVSMAAALQAQPAPHARVSGHVWNADDRPVRDAAVRLRSVVAGQVVAETVADETGAFAFQPVAPGTYVVEHVDREGQVVAVGQIFSASAGEVVVTFIRLPGRRALLASLFGSLGNTAATVVATAASLGVTALRPAGRAVTPDQ